MYYYDKHVIVNVYLHYMTNSKLEALWNNMIG